LGELIRRAVPLGGTPILIKDFDGDLMMSLDPSEHMQNQIFWYGYYSLDLIPLLKRILKPGNIFIDCGANIGELTLVGRNLVGNEGQVFAFEPLAELASRLEHNIEMNRFTNVRVIQKGVAKEPGVADFYRAQERFSDGLRNEGLGSLYSNEDRSLLQGKIELTALDRFVEECGLARLDLIKLDIEGGELPALEGARETLKALRPDLILELNQEMCTAAGYSIEEAYEFLASMNYSIYRVGRRGSIEPISARALLPFQNLYCAYKL
jgi:FkbM family methyltransferase